MATNSPSSIDLNGATVLVSDTGRGLGRAFVDAFLKAGARRVYAGMREPIPSWDAQITTFALDTTCSASVMAACEMAGEVNILVNNASVTTKASILGLDAEQTLRDEFEVNVFGTLSMVRSFAPILARNGGGAIVNMLSAVSWYLYPFNATCCPSMHAQLALTNSARIELNNQGTHVIGVYAGFQEGDMSVAVLGASVSPAHVAERTLAAIRSRQPHVMGDEFAETMHSVLFANPVGRSAESIRL